MSKYTNSLQLPFAAKLDEFKMLREGVDIRDELTHLEHEMKAAARQIAQELAEDPKIKELAAQHKQHGEGEGEAKPEQQEQQTNEGLGLGLALSAAGIIELTGKLLKLMGKKFGNEEHNLAIKVGEALEHYGHGLQNGIFKVIMYALKPVTFWMSEEKRMHMAKGIFMVALIIKITQGGLNFNDILQGKELSLQIIEKGLTAVKVNEIVAIMKQVVPALVNMVKGGE